MMRISVFLFMLMSFSKPTAIGASSLGDEILAAVKSRINHGGNLSEVYDLVDDLPIKESKALYIRVNRVWPKLTGNYISNFKRHAKNAGNDTKENKTHIRDLRKELESMKSLADRPMKDVLKKRGITILSELRKLLIPNTELVLSTANETLKKERRSLIAYAGLRDALIKAAIIPSDSTSLSPVTTAEEDFIRQLSGLDRKGLRVMAKNRKTAKKPDVTETERKGVEDANIMRLLAGYNALEIDPNLCAAARDHSKDMETHNFFAHNSPLKGKKTPWDRAKIFSTTASGENIFMGSTDPLAANRGWFFSPGHHRNMFDPRHKRIGLGQHNRHWTQLFGS